MEVRHSFKGAGYAVECPGACPGWKSATAEPCHHPMVVGITAWSSRFSLFNFMSLTAPSAQRRILREWES